ncbi:MAG: hypothetical protein AB1742_15080 [bacterium]
MTLTELFSSRKMVLIVSLPANDPVIARGAATAGADALKAHLNVTHPASGTRFGSFDEERGNLEKILSCVPIPVGVMPGAENPASVEDMKRLSGMGISFFDIYDHHMPEGYWELEGLEKMIAVGAGSGADAVERLEKRGARHLEASIIPVEKYGERLSVGDLNAYADVARRFGGTVTVPTQKRIEPGELKMLHMAGVRGIMIGAVVTGADSLSVRESVKRYRKALDAL